MKESYHCRPCDKEFIREDLAPAHRQTTGYEVIRAGWKDKLKNSGRKVGKLCLLLPFTLG